MEHAPRWDYPLITYPLEAVLDEQANPLACRLALKDCRQVNSGQLFQNTEQYFLW